MSRNNHKRRSLSYKYAAVPFDVLRSSEFMALSDAAKALMLDLMEQYSGGNNGHLTPSWTVMRRRAWGGKTKLAKAKRELLATSFCVMTRKGKPPQTAEWVGFTWWKLNYHDTMEIDRSKWPYLNFVSIENARVDPNEGREKLNPVVPKRYRYKISGSPKIVPMEHMRAAL